MEWINLVQIPVLILLLAQFLNTICKNGIHANVYCCAYYFFFLFFVIPEAVSIIFGKPDLGYFYGYRLMKDDYIVEAIYLAFIALNSFVFQKNAALHYRDMPDISLEYAVRKLENTVKKIHIPKILNYISFIISMLPTLFALAAPRPSLYFLSFIPFYQKDLNAITLDDLDWHFSYVIPCLHLVIFGVIILWIQAMKYMGTKKYHLYRLYLFIVALEVLLFYNKRAPGTILFTIMILLDVYFKKKFPTMEVILGFGGLISFFVVYHIVSGKANSSLMLYRQVWNPVYHMYFSRATDMKFVIYSLLHSDIVEILQYPCQTLIYDLLFYIPREWWPSKPYLFSVYYMAAWGNRSLEMVLGHMRVNASVFAEIAANLGWLGVPFSTFVYCRMLKFFSRLKNEFLRMYAILISVLLCVFPLGSIMAFVSVFVLLYFFLEKRWRMIIGSR